MKDTIIKVLCLFFTFLIFLCFSYASPYEFIKTDSEHKYVFKDGRVLIYNKPNFYKQLGYGPKDWFGFIRNSFKHENTAWLAAIGGSTLILMKYDREIYEETQRFAQRLNISRVDKTKTFIRVNGISIFRGPTDLGSAMYFIGDGWISIGLFASFKAYGLFKDNWRANSTANQLMEGLILTGFTTQFLKWSSGREMPKMAGENSTGRWHPFAKDYISERKRYDAFPSGHLATGMMTLTVISENYPEKKYIKPLGYSLLFLLSFQMINNGVHWASDYPLGLAIGYGIGKSITSRYKQDGTKQKSDNFFLMPYLTADGVAVISGYRF